MTKIFSSNLRKKNTCIRLVRLSVLLGIITYHIDSTCMLINLNVNCSGAILLHEENIMKQTHIYRKHLSLFLWVYTSFIVSWTGINFVLRHKYDSAASEDLVVAVQRARF